MAATYAASGTRVAFNGANTAAGTAARYQRPATYTTLRFGIADNASNNPANGYIRRVIYWPRALSDAEMQQVTT